MLRCLPVLCFLCPCLVTTIQADPPEQKDKLAELIGPTPVEVETLDGRKLVGHLDPESNSQIIHLRSERPGIVLQTHIPVERIRQIAPYDDSHMLRIVGPQPPRLSRSLVGPPHIPPHAPAPPPVQSLHVTAWVENWDRDAELDGLRLLVRPQSAQGVPIPVKGSLNADLIARRFDSIRNQDRIGVIEQWSQQLTVRNFGPGGAIVDLPFQRLDPERDLKVIPIGLLKVRLGIAGQGVFEAADVELPLRPTSYIKDELQLHSGRRQPQRLPTLPRLETHPAE